MRGFSNILRKKLSKAVMLSLMTLSLWLIVLFLFMNPSSEYERRVLKEAELVSAAIARAALAKNTASVIGGNFRSSDGIDSRTRSPFIRKELESVLRHLAPIIHKRIVIYDHQQRRVMDSFYFIQINKITSKPIKIIQGDENDESNQSDENASVAEPQKAKDIDKPIDFISPPRGNHPFIVEAMGGDNVKRHIILGERQNEERSLTKDNPTDFRFHPQQSILQIAVPIKRLKLVQGVVLLIDNEPQEQALWRFQNLLDHLHFFILPIIAFCLLWWWLQKTMASPLANLAYNRADLSSSRHDEINLIAQRQRASQIAIKDLFHTTKNFAQISKQHKISTKPHEIADCEAAAHIYNSLIDAQIEKINLLPFLSQIVQNQNQRVEHYIRKQASALDERQYLPFEDMVRLTVKDAPKSETYFQRPIFARALAEIIDFLIQGALAAQPAFWSKSVKLSLVKKSRLLAIEIEDDGDDLASYEFKSFIARAYDDDNPPLYSLHAIETTLAMHNAAFHIISLRPAKYALTFALSFEYDAPQKRQKNQLILKSKNALRMNG